VVGIFTARVNNENFHILPTPYILGYLLVTTNKSYFPVPH